MFPGEGANPLFELWRSEIGKRKQGKERGREGEKECGKGEAKKGVPSRALYYNL